MLHFHYFFALEVNLCLILLIAPLIHSEVDLQRSPLKGKLAFVQVSQTLSIIVLFLFFSYNKEFTYMHVVRVAKTPDGTAMYREDANSLTITR